MSRLPDIFIVKPACIFRNRRVAVIRSFCSVLRSTRGAGETWPAAVCPGRAVRGLLGCGGPPVLAPRRVRGRCLGFFELSQLHMSPYDDHGVVEGMGHSKILRLCQGQLKFSCLEGNACCGQIRAQRGGQHEKQSCKRGHNAQAVQKIAHH